MMKPRNEISPAELSRILKESLPQAPPSPWFTRKVLNRLPQRRAAMAARIEYAVYIIGLIVTAIYGATYVHDTLASGEIAVADALTYMVFLGLFGSLLYLIISPYYHAASRQRHVPRH
ncbi:MAG: hypothetical protein NC043_08880 [Muribaculaceae bacterium]|nr:hypothetical protein [Muribaculaceae bacterium]